MKVEDQNNFRERCISCLESAQKMFCFLQENINRRTICSIGITKPGRKIILIKKEQEKLKDASKVSSWDIEQNFSA